MRSPKGFRHAAQGSANPGSRAPTIFEGHGTLNGFRPTNVHQPSTMDGTPLGFALGHGRHFIAIPRVALLATLGCMTQGRWPWTESLADLWSQADLDSPGEVVIHNSKLGIGQFSTRPENRSFVRQFTLRRLLMTVPSKDQPEYSVQAGLNCSSAIF